MYYLYRDQPADVLFFDKDTGFPLATAPAYVVQCKVSICAVLCRIQDRSKILSINEINGMLRDFGHDQITPQEEKTP